MEILIISGLSGAGKSKAASCLEDMGFSVVDNMPPALLPSLARLWAGQEDRRTALVADIRGGETFGGLFDALDTLDALGVGWKILFLEAAPAVIIKRYKETRRSHPLAGPDRSLEEAVRQERDLLAPVRERAAHIVNTTALTTGKLRGELYRLFGDGSRSQAMSISVLSFGFKYGLPLEADLVFDVRFLPNPYYDPALRGQTGLDEPVRRYVFDAPQTHTFMEQLEAMMGFLLPQYISEGKTALVIAVGCTGGQHRSVAVAHALTGALRRLGYPVSEHHRDMTRA